MSTQLNVSTDEMEQVFALWSEKYENDPDAFEEDYGDDHTEYGESCTVYFTKLLSEIKGDNFKEIDSNA